MYSTHNERKSVAAERFIRMLKNKIYKYMTSISKNVYIDKLDDIVNEYNNTYHTTIKMKIIHRCIKDNTYINTDTEVNDKDSKFKISKYKNIFAKGYTPNWSEVFMIKEVKNTVPWTYVTNDLNGEEITGAFYEKDMSLLEEILMSKSIYLIMKTDLKNISHIDVSSYVLKSNLASLKTEVDKLDNDKLKPVPNDLAKLSNVVKNDVVKKTKYDKFVAKVNSINNTKFYC